MDRIAVQCSIQVEDVFGPQVSGCHNNFDFTLLFEESILYLAPLTIASLVATLRILQLQSKPNIVSPNVLLTLKQQCWTVFIVLQFAHFVLSLTTKTSNTRLSIAVIVLGLLASSQFAFLSYWEHYRSQRPSTILNVYLLGTIPMDAARARTLFSMPSNRSVAAMFITATCCKFILLLVEAKDKRNLLGAEARFLSPEQTAGILDRSFFWWFNPLLLTGSKKNLTVDDLFTIDEDIALDRWRERLHYHWANANAEKPHELLKVLLTVFKGPILAGVLPRLCMAGLTFAQPFLVNRVVNFMSEPDNELSNDIASGLIAAYAIVYFGIAIVSTMYQHKTYRTLPMVRGGVISLIYRHTLSLDASSSSESACLTLINADVERLTFGMRNMHEIWASFIEIALSLWLLEINLGVSTIAVAAVVIACLAANGRFSLLIGTRQKVWLEAIQERVTTTVAVIGSITGIKATGSTQTVRSIISDLRDQEIKISLRYREVMIALVTLSYVSNIMAPVFAFGTYSVLANIRHTTPLLAATAFTSLTIMSLLSQAVQRFIDAAMGVFSAVASLERVRKYLASGTRIDHRVLRPRPMRLAIPSFHLPNSRDSWIEMFDLGMPQRTGSVQRHDRFLTLLDCAASYEESAEPTISDINIKISRGSLTMIIGPVGCGKSALLKTMLGETPYTRGSITVQKADAAFCGQTVWLTNTTVRNNILGVSRMDPFWYNRVVRACALDRDFTQLPEGDQSIIGSKGIVLSGGQKSRLALARALYAKKSFVVLDDVFSGLDARTEQHVFNCLFGQEGLLSQGDTTTVLATNSIRNIPFADNIIVLSQDGKIVEQGSYHDLLYSGGYLESLDPQEQLEEKFSQEDDDEASLLPASLTGKLAVAGTRDFTDLSIYKYYIDQIGWGPWAFFVLLCGGFVFGLIFPQAWIRLWTEANSRNPDNRLGYWLGLYTLWSTLGVVIFVLACCHLMLNMARKAARKFHHALLETVLRAPLNFFSTTDSGETSNRFTQDLELIDMELPIALIGTVVTLLLCFGQLGVVVSGSSYIAATIPGMIVILYFVQLFYLKTSRQLRILDIEAKAPLLSHFMETIHGLIDLRAFNWTKQYTSRHDELLERSQRPFYMLYCAQRWLNLVLEMVVAVLAVIFVSIGVLTKHSTGSMIGLALVNIVGFGTTLKSLVYNWTSLEMIMGAIARIRLFTNNTPCEDLPGEDGIPPPNWPAYGMVTFENVSAAYDSLSKPVLKHVSFEVRPGEKLAICGRTGSGKSSTVATLLRLMDLRAGRLTIDGIDLSTISRQEVRSHINTLPQEPLFYHASIRGNLNITGSLPDERLFEALQLVGLHELVIKKGGLDIMMSDGLLSHGQKQLFCLARATLHPSRILILDEATSGVDKNTESLMLNVINRVFHHHTIICIAHRLNTIIDYDQVLVLDAGQVIEQGNPRTLATQPSMFASLLRASNNDAGTKVSNIDLTDYSKADSKSTNEHKNEYDMVSEISASASASASYDRPESSDRQSWI